MCGRQNVNNTEIGPGAALIEDANERMRGKSAEPVEQCQPNGELALCESIEVGCRGFAQDQASKGPQKLSLMAHYHCGCGSVWYE